MKDKKTRTGLILTILFSLLGLTYFNHTFSQNEFQILQDITKVEGGGFTSKLFLFYMFTKLVTSIVVEVTAPHRAKIAEFINVWIDAKIKSIKNE